MADSIRHLAAMSHSRPTIANNKLNYILLLRSL